MYARFNCLIYKISVHGRCRYSYLKSTKGEKDRKRERDWIEELQNYRKIKY